MIKVFNKRYLIWGLPVLTGIFLCLASLFSGFNFLTFFAFLPLFFFLTYQKLSFKKYFFAGFLAGFIYLGWVVSWLFEMLPLSWIGIENNIIGFFVLLFPWILFISILSSFFGLFTLCYAVLKKNNFFDILLIPSLWIIFEYTRAIAFGLFLWGKESVFGAHWTFGNIAYNLAENAVFRWVSGIGGIYFVSFFVVLINVLFFIFIKKIVFKKPIFNKINIFYIIVSVIIPCLVTYSYFFRPFHSIINKEKSISFAAIQSKIPSFFHLTKEISIQKLTEQKQMLLAIASKKLDLVVFPEDSRFLSQEDSKDFLKKIFNKRNVIVVDSARTETKEGIKAVSNFYDIQKETSFYYEKNLLSPLGEYLPYIFKIPAKILNSKWLESFENSRGYKKGISSFPYELNGSKIISLFCSELVSPYIYQKAEKQGANIFLNLGSLAFVKGSKNFDQQTLKMLQFRAAENNRYLIRATNYGFSYFISNEGKIFGKPKNLGNQVMLGQVFPYFNKTIYNRFGDWILILAILIIGASRLKLLTFLNK